MTSADPTDETTPGRGQLKRALLAYAIALVIALSAEWGIRYLEPETLPTWFDFVQTVTFLMVGIVFAYVGFLPPERDAARKMAWANVALLALPYALVFVLNPLGEALVTWMVVWPVATVFLLAAATAVGLILTAPGWLGWIRRHRGRPESV